MRRRYDFFNAHSHNTTAKMFSINLIAISQQEAWRCLFREGFNDLSGGPESRGMGRHIEVDHLPPVMEQNNIQHVEGHSRQREEVNRYNLAGMIDQKALPVL